MFRTTCKEMREKFGFFNFVNGKKFGTIFRKKKRNNDFQVEVARKIQFFSIVCELKIIERQELRTIFKITCKNFQNYDFQKRGLGKMCFAQFFYEIKMLITQKFNPE